MGRPDQIAKRIFREETSASTGDRVAFEDAPEIATGARTPDGLVRLVVAPAQAATLPPPWSLLVGTAVMDLKMPGDHLNEVAVARVEFRRHAAWVQRLEVAPPAQPTTPLQASLAAWVVAPYLPAWLRDPKARGEWNVTPEGAGCYGLGPRPYPLLWIASNELPLDPALLPFLIARSRRHLVEFATWAVRVRGAAWVAGVLQELPMASELLDEVLHVPQGEAEQKALHVEFGRRWLRRFPEAGEEVRTEGLTEGRSETLRHLFEHRLRRPLTNLEQATLIQRVEVLGAERVSDVVIDLDAGSLAAWLADPTAR